jgi:phage FluMu gp28-like protein
MPSKLRKQTVSVGNRPAAQVITPKSLLFPWQRRWVEDSARFKIGVWCRQSGKSFSTSAEAVENCLSDPGAKWVCLSAGERQSLEWLEKAKEWSEAYKLSIANYAEDRGMAEALLKSAEIRYANGSRIIALPANPSTARGYSANVILDEFAYHEDPDKIWAAMFPSISNPLAGTFLERMRAMTMGSVAAVATRAMKIRIVSTFNGRGNKFYQLWEKREQNGYSGHLVDIHQAIREGLPADVKQLREGLDDAEIWAQEFECQAVDTSNVLLPYDLIAGAESADATESCAPEFWESTSANPIYLGIDFGRTNDPTVCWAWERIGDTLWTREVLVLRNVATPEQTELLRMRIKRATRAALDYTGPGIGLGDYLVKEFGQWDPDDHKFGKVELCTFTSGFKRLIFPRLRRSFEPPVKVRVPISRDVREDLHAMQQIVHNGEYNYWAPRSRDGHSDRCTAAALGRHAAGDGPRGIERPSAIHFGRPSMTAFPTFHPARLTAFSRTQTRGGHGKSRSAGKASSELLPAIAAGSGKS